MQLKNSTARELIIGGPDRHRHGRDLFPRDDGLTDPGKEGHVTHGLRIRRLLLE